MHYGTHAATQYVQYFKPCHALHSSLLADAAATAAPAAVLDRCGPIEALSSLSRFWRVEGESRIIGLAIWGEVGTGRMGNLARVPTCGQYLHGLGERTSRDRRRFSSSPPLLDSIACSQVTLYLLRVHAFLKIACAPYRQTSQVSGERGFPSITVSPPAQHTSRIRMKQKLPSVPLQRQGKSTRALETSSIEKGGVPGIGLC